MHSYDEFPSLRFERPQEGVLQIVLSGANRNAPSHQAHADLVHVWERIREDPSVRCVLLRGEGEDFCSGGSVELAAPLVSDWNARVRLFEEARLMVRNFIDCPVPIVSAVNGAAYGAGLALALLADVSVVGRTARLRDSHVSIGLAAGDHAVLCWPLLVGMAKAKYYLLTNKLLLGEEAERIGLVSLCVDDAEVQAEAAEIASAIAAAVQWTKHTLNHWYRQATPAFEAALALEVLGFTNPELKEKFTAAG